MRMSLFGGQCAPVLVAGKLSHYESDAPGTSKSTPATQNASRNSLEDIIRN